MAELAVRETLALVGKVIIILYQKFERPTDLHDDVERIQNFLEMMHACLRDSEDSINKNRHLFLQLQDVAYRIEEVVEEFMLKLVADDVQTNNISQQTDDEVANFIASWEPSCKLSSDVNEILGENTDFVKQLASLPYDSQGGSRSGLGDSLTLPYCDLAEGDEVVGLEEPKQKLLKQLIDVDSKLLTIFIVGPGGSGKSTLVKNVFNSKEVRGYFNCQTWVPVLRRPLQLNELLLNMLTDLGDKPAVVEEVDPKAKLRLFLQQKRYLVVLDDVWSKQDLQYIVKALPNGFHGTKIIITSRNSDVASFLSPKYIHDLSSGLSSEKAKDLFCRKAFHDAQGNLPPVLERSPDYSPTRTSKAFDKSEGYYLSELEECSDKILKWCGGLPLALSAVGTLLAKKPQTQVEWEEFLENIGTEIRPGSSLSIISSILEPSYMDLPNHLKTCFLYLGVFPAHYRIQRERLIRLWVAEGFVKPRRGITVEQVAQGYLNELIARNLVLGEINEKDCCVLNLVRDFIISKAENFITVLEPNCSTTSTSGEQIRRLSVHGADRVDLQLLSSGHGLKHIRTLLVFANYSHSDLETVLKTSKFVRVLHLEGISELEEYFPKSVDDLILLKYLSLTGPEFKTVPKSIRKLRFLETLELAPMVEELPEEICQLYTLRHLLVYPRDDFWDGYGVKFSTGNIGALSSMQGLALIDVNRIIIKALGELKDLKKLEVVNLETEDRKELCIALEKMKHLSTLDVVTNNALDLDHMQCPPLYLQHLYLRGSPLRLPMWISKLTSLQMLHLEGSKRLSTNPLDVLEALPNLIELHLVACYSGKKLVFRAYTFKKLVKLNMKDFYGQNVLFEEGALPVLRKLHIQCCPKQKFLQCDLPVLRELDIFNCQNLESLKGDLPVLRELHIQLCGKLKFLQCDLPVLRELTISNCPYLESLPMWISKLTSLQKLRLVRSDQLNTNPLDVLEDLPNLMELHVSYYSGEVMIFRASTFKKLVKLNIEDFYELNSMVFEEGALPVLRELDISNCQNLESLNCDLPVLRKLTISRCLNLERRPYGLPGINIIDLDLEDSSSG